MQRRLFVFFLTFFIFPVFLFAAQKEMYVTTYYPAPHGEYTDITTQTLKIGAGNTASTKNGVINFIGLAADPSGANDGDLYYNIENAGSHKFKYYDSTANGGGGAWQDVGGAATAYDLSRIAGYNATISDGWAQLVNITGSGVLLGGSVTGHRPDYVRVIADGVTKDFFIPLSEIEDGNVGDDFASGPIPGPIKFSTSLIVVFRDVEDSNTLTSGVAYVYQ